MNKYENHKQHRAEEIYQRITLLGRNPGFKIYRKWVQKNKEKE